MSNNSNVPVSKDTKDKIKKLQVIYGKRAIIPIKFTQEETLDIIVTEAYDREKKNK